MTTEEAAAVAEVPVEAKPAKAKKVPKEKKLAAHPSYAEMISEAIAALKERTGSSSVAIGKYVEEKHGAKLPPHFRKLLSVQLKKLAAAGKLTRVKNSFKLPAARPASADAKPKAAAAAKPKPKAKPATAAKPNASPKAKAKTAAKPKAASPKAKAKAAGAAPRPRGRPPKAAKASPAKAAKKPAAAAKKKSAASPKKAGTPKKAAAAPARKGAAKKAKK